MDAVASKIIDVVNFLVVKNMKLIWNFKDDLENMKSAVTAIKAVLGDAEGKATNNLQTCDWLQKVKDIFLDADDLLDDLCVEALGRQVMTENYKRAKEVRIFFSKSNQVLYCLQMGHQLKRIMKRLDHVAKVKNDLKFIESPPQLPVLYRERQTYSYVPEHEVIGREEEKNCIISYLLDTNSNNNGVSIVSIIGIGGLGKTTLAQLVYSDKMVQNYFELNMWVCVSDEFVFDVRQIAQKILGQTTTTTTTCSEMELVQKDLRNKIEGKRFLLVLDDVWNEDRELWLKLKNLLTGGGRGSMIIVTTRSKHVARIMGADYPISLVGLDEKKSWELFTMVAFEKNDEEPNPKLVEIGKDIVKKCAGVPLAIRTLGSLLYSRNLGERDWEYFRDCELSKIDQKENKIFAILKLSYDHLPSHLKNCFSYCSLFPKDYEIERETLIQLWVAQGFIQISDQRCVEDVAHEYFIMLLSRCLFQDVKLDEYGEINKCKMHDLIHDLSRLVTQKEYYISIGEGRKEENLGDAIRHVSSECNSKWDLQTFKGKTNKLRTILSPIGVFDIIPSHLPPLLLSLSELFGVSTISFPKCLRVLDVHGFELEDIPKSLEKLKHLRYLDLSCSNFKKLPQIVTKLHKLQTLKLNSCWMLEELPRDMTKMVSLRHLELDGCDRLICMPRGLQRLAHLQTLTQFVLNDGSYYSASLSELQGLNNLKGKLVIKRLKHQRSNNIQEVRLAKLLLEKPYLQELRLLWGRSKMEQNHCQQKHEDEMLLEALEPNHTIKILHIDQFCGMRLPKWIANLTSLLKLQISHCNHLASLPKSIGNLSSLQELQLIKCSTLASLPKSIGHITSMKKLKLVKCYALSSLPNSIGNLTSLQELELLECYALVSLPKSIGNITSLKKLILIKCYDLSSSALSSISKSIEKLTSLQELRLSEPSLPQLMRNITSLNEMQNS